MIEFWLAIVLIFLIIEILSPSFIAIFFSIGALLPIVFVALDFSLVWQIASFALMTIISVMLLRKPIQSMLNKKAKQENLPHPLAEHQGIMTQSIPVPFTMGKAEIGGTSWAVTSDMSIDVGQQITVIGGFRGQDLVLEVISNKQQFNMELKK